METSPAYSVYPRSDIDPKEKNIDWGRQYARAAWYDWSATFPRTCFYNAADKYEELRLYSQGKQPVQRYKKIYGVDEQTNLTFSNIDWEVRPFIVQKRDVAIAKMCQAEHDIVATPIDITAKAELDKFYAEAKVKIAMRQLMQQQNPQLASHPLLQSNPGEPLDWDEMQMRIDFGEQFNRAKDAEEAIQLGFYHNKIREFRKKIYEDLFDCGVAGYKEWLDDNNMPGFRNVNVEAVISSYCRWSDFRDQVHAGEMIDVDINDLAVMTNPDGTPLFTGAQLEDLRNNVAGKWSNPSLIGRSTNYYHGYDRFKCKVLDMEFYSWNDYSYGYNVDKRGNLRFSQQPYNKKNNGKEKGMRKRIKVVYCIKWIIGTEYAYDFHLKEDMKRSVNNKKKAETSLSYKFIATNFYEMRCTGMMERLRPIIDDYQMTIYRIQNLKARLVPNGWWIDLDALENVALNKGGENMKPLDLLQMFMETGVLVGRSMSVMGDNVNYKPIIPLQNSIAAEITAMYQDLQISMNQIQAMIGLNDATDASTPSPKLLNGVASMMDQGTNNSLWPMIEAQKNLITNLANDVMMRIQQGIKKGGISGYAPALNTNTLKFIKVSDALSLRDYGIMLEDRPTEDQKQMLMQQMQFDIQNGFLDTSDALYVMNIYNVKQAQQMLAYKVKRSKMLTEQAKQASTAQTIQGQQQTAQLSAQMAAQQIQLQGQIDMQKIQLQGQIDMQLLKMKLSLEAQATDQTNQVKMAGHVIAAQSKENVQKRQAGVPEAQIPQIVPPPQGIPEGQPAQEEEPEGEMA